MKLGWDQGEGGRARVRVMVKLRSRGINELRLGQDQLWRG